MPSLPAVFRLLKSPTGPNVFNPWRDHDPETDIHPDAPWQRLQRLQAHLRPGAKYLLIGEAAGYQGCKVTGIPFTSERLILEGVIPRVTSKALRLTSRTRPWSEPSATIVWGTLHKLGMAGDTVLWNAFPWHPYKSGNPHSNRTPTTSECIAAQTILKMLLALYPKAKVLAVGRQAEAALMLLGVPAITLRHPSMGGAKTFARQLHALHKNAQ